MTTIINTAKSLNKTDWLGYTIYVTRTQQRHKKYQSDLWIPQLGNKTKSLKKYQDWLISYASGFVMERTIEILKEHKETTLLCFCKDINKCHRKVLQAFLVSNFPDDFELGQIK